jgi:transcriptional regulator with XRE-family HTH domain
MPDQPPTPNVVTATAKTPYALEIGRRLRAVRRLRGLSLMDVEEQSGGRHKGVVVSSYERADRNPTAERLAGLAYFYGVQLSDLAPPHPDQDPASLTQGALRTAIAMLEGAGRPDLADALRPLVVDAPPAAADEILDGGAS